MSRKDEVTRNYISRNGLKAEQKITRILYDISVTLAIMCDLMKDEKKSKTSIVLTPSELRIDPKETDNV